MKQIVAASLISASFSATPQERAKEMLSQMNFTEKVLMMHGHKGIRFCKSSAHAF
jgi:hypothetical protein